MRLIGTRIRVEKSDVKTEYFPEYCLEEKTWFGFGKPKQGWYGICQDSTHSFGEAYRAVRQELHSGSLEPFTLVWAQRIIDFQAHYYKERLEYLSHEETKETTYVKYP